MVTYYTMSDSTYFVGTVALLNSLRLTGHDGELVVLDCGLTTHQVRRLEPHCRVAPAARRVGHRGLPMKPFAWKPDSRGVAAIIDSDILVTGRLSGPLRDAEEGRIAVFAESDPRSFPQWAEVLELEAPARSGRYVSSGFVAFSVERWPELLPRWRDACRLALQALQRDGPSSPEPARNPFAFTEQDVLTALLLSEVPPEAAAVHDYELAPMQFRRDPIVVRDAVTLRCELHGRHVLLLHGAGRPKPWSRGSWIVRSFEPYAALLPRVLFGRDVALRLAPGEAPPWLWPGAGGAAIRAVLGRVRRGLKAGVALAPDDARIAIRRWVRKHAGDDYGRSG